MKNEKGKKTTHTLIMNTTNTDCNLLLRKKLHEILHILVSNSGAANVILVKV